MLIRLSSIDPKVAELIESNNQQERLISALSSKLTVLSEKVNALEEQQKLQKLRELNQY